MFHFLFFYKREREKVRDETLRNKAASYTPTLSQKASIEVQFFNCFGSDLWYFFPLFFFHCLPLCVKEAEGTFALIKKEPVCCSFSQSKLMGVCTLHLLSAYNVLSNLARMTGLHPYSFSKHILGFLMTTESQDLGLTSHLRDGAF